MPFQYVVRLEEVEGKMSVRSMPKLFNRQARPSMLTEAITPALP